MSDTMSHSADIAADIISFIGIPLAVLGVLPMLYTCIKCLLTLRLIRRTLSHANLSSATTRSSLLSGIIEIEMPRQRLVPLERFDQHYFDVNPNYSRLKGGSWTRFRWKEMTIGFKSYRVQFHDEVRQPQAEIEFEQLVAFLLDRGAVPYPAGFALLRHSGLWTPAGTKLLSSPRGAEAVLSVTAADDADGILSLAVEWEPEWQKHRGSALPPYWIRIEAPPPKSIEAESSEKTAYSEDKKDEKHPATSRSTISYPHLPLHLHVTSSGLHTALYEPPSASSPISSTTSLTDPSPTHLLPPLNHPTPASTWFATALTALHTLSPSPTLWSYSLPPALISLCLRPTIPLGVLDLLSLLPPTSPLPNWRTASAVSAETELAFRNLAQQQEFAVKVEAMRAEGRITNPAERQRAIGERMMRELREADARRRTEQLEEVRRREEEEGEAVRSERVEAGVVAGLAVRWLRGAGDVVVLGMEGSEEEKKTKVDGVDRQVLVKVVERVLYQMVEDVGVAEGVVKMLELWREWGEAGGMTVQHLRMLREELRSFASAAALVCLVREAAMMPAGSVVSDLQECLRAWKKVRLG